MTPLKPILKMRRLPNTDVARIATMKPEDMAKALVPFCYPSKNVKSYAAVRSVQNDIFQVSTPLLNMPNSELSHIERIIEKKCKNEDVRDMNLRAARALYSGLKSLQCSSRADERISSSIGFTGQRTFDGWLKILSSMLIDERPIIPVVDFRSNKGLIPRTHKFVFSVMNIAIRESAPEYEQARFAILRLPYQKKVAKSDEPIRQLKVILDNEDYYSFEEVEAMITETYSVYDQVLREEWRRAA